MRQAGLLAAAGLFVFSILANISILTIRIPNVIANLYMESLEEAAISSAASTPT